MREARRSQPVRWHHQNQAQTRPFPRVPRAFLLQNQPFFIAHGGRFRLGGFRRGRVMLRFRDVQRLDFYVVGQVRFLGRIERDGFGDRLRLLPCGASGVNRWALRSSRRSSAGSRSLLSTRKMGYACDGSRRCTSKSPTSVISKACHQDKRYHRTCRRCQRIMDDGNRRFLFQHCRRFAPLYLCLRLFVRVITEDGRYRFSRKS